MFFVLFLYYFPFSKIIVEPLIKRWRFSRFPMVTPLRLVSVGFFYFFWARIHHRAVLIARRRLKYNPTKYGQRKSREKRHNRAHCTIYTSGRVISWCVCRSRTMTKCTQWLSVVIAIIASKRHRKWLGRPQSVHTKTFSCSIAEKGRVAFDDRKRDRFAYACYRDDRRGSGHVSDGSGRVIAGYYAVGVYVSYITENAQAGLSVDFRFRTRAETVATTTMTTLPWQGRPRPVLASILIFLTDSFFGFL